MIKINIPINSVYFSCKEEFLANGVKVAHTTSEAIMNFPETYPCYGWNVKTIYKNNGPEQFWAFVYPV